MNVAGILLFFLKKKRIADIPTSIIFAPNCLQFKMSCTMSHEAAELESPQRLQLFFTPVARCNSFADFTFFLLHLVHFDLTYQLDGFNVF